MCCTRSLLSRSPLAQETINCIKGTRVNSARRTASWCAKSSLIILRRATRTPADLPHVSERVTGRGQVRPAAQRFRSVGPKPHNESTDLSPARAVRYCCALCPLLRYPSKWCYNIHPDHQRSVEVISISAVREMDGASVTSLKQRNSSSRPLLSATCGVVAGE